MSNPRPRRVALHAAAILIGLVVCACLYDAGHRCGPAMTYVEAANACLCDQNAVPVAGRCLVCAPDEVASGGMCKCSPGQIKDASNVCMAVSGLGDPCDASTPCAGATYSYCATPAGATAGTCEKPCGSNTDCAADYTCTTWDDRPYCRTFQGFGDSCTSQDDCTGDAKYCDMVVSHVCLVADCSLTASDCPRDTMCCDYSAYQLGTLCTQECL